MTKIFLGAETLSRVVRGGGYPPGYSFVTNSPWDPKNKQLFVINHQMVSLAPSLLQMCPLMEKILPMSMLGGAPGGGGQSFVDRSSPRITPLASTLNSKYYTRSRKPSQEAWKGLLDHVTTNFLFSCQNACRELSFRLY